MVQVIPGILEQDFEKIKERIKLIENLVSWAQIDLLDNSLFGESNFNDPTQFGKLKTPLNLELHMMVKNPQRMISAWAEAGFKRFIAHTEGLENIDGFITEVKENLGLEAGLAVDLETPVDAVLPYLNQVDCVLIMTVAAGKSGQSFHPEALEKIVEIKKLRSDIAIEIDGGVNLKTGKTCRQKGATRLVSTSYIFSSGNIKKAIEELKRS